VCHQIDRIFKLFLFANNGQRIQIVDQGNTVITKNIIDIDVRSAKQLSCMSQNPLSIKLAAELTDPIYRCHAQNN
jgi:hypothetical protein